MTSLTYAMSRAIGRDLGPGDEIVLTLLDHDANFSPWKALEEKGVVIRAVSSTKPIARSTWRTWQQRLENARVWSPSVMRRMP